MAILDRARDALGVLRGQKQVAVAEAPAALKPGVEVGWGGTKITAGVVQDDHVSYLQGVAGLQAATRMRRSSAQVRCTERMVSLPIRCATWLIEEPQDASQTEKEAATLLRENLLGGGMDTSWDAVLREACLAVYYGFRVPEIVWEEREGALAIKKIASRNPELVERWLYDATGSNLVGFLYVGNKPNGTGLTDSYGAGASAYERIPVPIEKTLHFAYESENESPVGFGLYRSMYQHWDIVQKIYKVMCFGIERNLLGVPIGRLQNGAQADDRSKLLTILRRWRAAEDAAVVLTEGQDIDFVGNQATFMDAMPFVNHHDTKIAQAGLAAFMNLGQGEVGTQAVGTVLARMFETSEDAAAHWIEDCINSQLIHRWSQANYGVDYRQRGFRPPKLQHKPIKANDLQVWATVLSTLMSAGALHPVPDDEQKIRDMLELPQVSLEDLQAAEEERQNAAEEQRNAELLKLQKLGMPGGSGDNGDMNSRDKSLQASEDTDALEGVEESTDTVEAADLPKFGHPAKCEPQPGRRIGNRPVRTPEERALLAEAIKAERRRHVQDDGK